MSAETDSLAARIACLPLAGVPMTLVSTTGFNCDVWRCAISLRVNGKVTPLDFVIKHHLEPCGLAQVAVFNKHYRMLREALGDIVPEALFIATKVDGAPNAVVLAEACESWFNLANPGNESEAVELLRRAPRTRDQLRLFVTAAARWRAAEDSRVIDLYGLDNLVIDRSLRVRYVDSFHVFFYPDMLQGVSEADSELERRITLSLERLEYLAYVLTQAQD